jgi:hypothetical protein
VKASATASGRDAQDDSLTDPRLDRSLFEGAVIHHANDREGLGADDSRGAQNEENEEERAHLFFIRLTP